MAKVDKEKRQAVSSHHTATHLLHWVLENYFGSHIRQAGSLVSEDRLRFDFNHHKLLSSDEINLIEKKMNQLIRKNGTIETEELTYQEVEGNSFIKQFFNEKYGEIVRVVTIDLKEDGVSKELCGGTHVIQTGELGCFQIIKSQTVASGICRIEAVVGNSAEKRIYKQTSKIKNLVNLFKVQEDSLEEHAGQLLRKVKDYERQLKEMKTLQMQTLVKEWVLNQPNMDTNWKIFYQEIDRR
ncbi:hypothetical protein [Candidatus Similichlamydia epinepheli]|uniref:hypothetical protein n=1 Tax=Candidatus Similichlamydia epinepheli TaxID=1903953 RepID=UPI000D37C9A8|nr:hypothetical protein [Candidatus Similichlamydia epinepheli]